MIEQLRVDHEAEKVSSSEAYEQVRAMAIAGRERLEAANSRIRELTTSFAAKEVELRRLKASHCAAVNRVDQVEEKYTALEHQVAFLVGKVTTFKERLAEEEDRGE